MIWEVSYFRTYLDICIYATSKYAPQILLLASYIPVLLGEGHGRERRTCGMPWHHPQGNRQNSHWKVCAVHWLFFGTSNAGEKENFLRLSIPLRGGSCYKEWLILKRSPSHIWFLLFRLLLLLILLRLALEIHSTRAQLNLVVNSTTNVSQWHVQIETGQVW